MEGNEGIDVENIKISLHRVFEHLGLLNRELFMQRSRMSKVYGKVLFCSFEDFYAFF